MNNVVLMTNFFLGKMRRMFFMAYPETKRDYKKSRICYTIGDTAAQTIAQLSGGTFLVALMEALDISDGNMGIISSFGSLAAIAQLISIKLSGRFQKNKLFICFTVLQKLWLSFIFFIPLMKMSPSAGRTLMIICYCFAQICIQVGTPATVDWIASLIPSKLRGRYFSIKDSVAVFVVVTVMLIMGILIDVLKAEHLHTAFIILGVSTGVLAAVNVIAFARMKEPKAALMDERGKEMIGTLSKKNAAYQIKRKEVNILQELKIAFQTKKFCQLLLFNCLWLTAFYIASPFNSSFQIKDLSLPYTFIMVISFITSLLRIYLTPKAGKLADRLGMARVMSWAFIAMGGHYLIMSLTTAATAYVMAVLAALCSSLGWVFIGIGMLGIQLDFLEEDKRIIQYSLLSILSGLYGFFISIVGGKIIDFLQARQWSIGGHPLYAQQFTNALGFLFIIITILYLKRKIQPVSDAAAKKKK